MKWAVQKREKLIDGQILKVDLQKKEWCYLCVCFSVCGYLLLYIRYEQKKWTGKDVLLTKNLQFSSNQADDLPK